MKNITELLDAMWRDYLEITPDARNIHQLFASQNRGIVVNDHIALRTYNSAKVSLEKVARPFLEAGYEQGGEYHFPARKLYARHYLPPEIPPETPPETSPDSHPPKVFISELLTEELSSTARNLVESLVDQLDEATVLQDDFCYSGRPWDITLAQYDQLLQESEYAAWVAAFGYRANHFTVSINHLQSHDDIHDLNSMLQHEGYQLNDTGGLVKGSPDVLLEQSSTLANKVPVSFHDGTREIPSCFYEFAKRYALPNGQLYQGFVAASADRIFSSTDTDTGNSSKTSAGDQST